MVAAVKIVCVMTVITFMLTAKRPVKIGERRQTCMSVSVFPASKITTSSQITLFSGICDPVDDSW